MEHLESRLTNSAGVSVVKLERAGQNLHLSHPERIVEEVRLLARRPEPMR